MPEKVKGGGEDVVHIKIYKTIISCRTHLMVDV